MKKILLAVTAALAITGCSQSEEFENPAQNVEIGFNTAVTRATAVTTATLNQFKVYGYAHAGDFSAATEATSIVNGTYGKKDGAWSENNSKKFYWPSEGNVTFFAYSPVGETGTTTYNAPTTYPNYPTIDYVVNDAIGSQSDFVVAQQTGDGTTNKDGIALGFKHTLTQIAFKLKGSDADVTYTVTKLVMKGVKNSGTYDWKAGSWKAKDGTKDYTIDMTAEGAATTFNGEAEAIELTGNDKVMMLIPQVPAATIDVTYTAEKDGIKVGGSDTKTVNVPADEWGVGERIVFTIALTPGNEITITGKIDDNSNWSDKDPQPGEL